MNTFLGLPLRVWRRGAAYLVKQTQPVIDAKPRLLLNADPRVLLGLSSTALLSSGVWCLLLLRCKADRSQRAARRLPGKKQVNNKEVKV